MSMNRSKKLEHLSKFLSFVLRHDPASIELSLDEAGWADIEQLLKSARAHGTEISSEELFEIVETSDKKRFSLSADKSSIRANQGHSIKVSLGYEASVPPLFLLHGTAKRFCSAIMNEGLKKMDRHHVHLTESVQTAKSVGTRYGELVLLKVRSRDMHEQGYKFFLSDNNVWLTEHVPVEYLEYFEGF